MCVCLRWFPRRSVHRLGVVSARATKEFKVIKSIRNSPVEKYIGHTMPNEASVCTDGLKSGHQKGQENATTFTTKRPPAALPAN